MRWVLFTISLLISVVSFADKPPQAVELLQKLEATQLETKPFQLNGVVSRSFASAHFWNTTFLVESAPDKYRIQVDGKPAKIVAANKRVTSALAFSPRAIDISSGVISFLSLKENVAYWTAQDFQVIQLRHQE